MNAQQQLLTRIISYCEENEEVRALILIGSQVRTEFHADEYCSSWVHKKLCDYV